MEKEDRSKGIAANLSSKKVTDKKKNKYEKVTKNQRYVSQCWGRKREDYGASHIPPSGREEAAEKEIGKDIRVSGVLPRRVADMTPSVQRKWKIKFTGRRTSLRRTPAADKNIYI